MTERQNSTDEQLENPQEKSNKFEESTKMIVKLRDGHKLVEERAIQLEKSWKSAKPSWLMRTRLFDLRKDNFKRKNFIIINYKRKNFPNLKNSNVKGSSNLEACQNPDDRLEGQGSTQKIHINSSQKAREHQLSPQRLGSFDTDFLIKVIKEDRKHFSIL